MPKKALLILSYYYPPHSVVGAIRVSRFAKLLSQNHGWEVHVVTAARPTTPCDYARVHSTGDFDVFRTLGRIRRRSRNTGGTSTNGASPGKSENDTASARRKKGLIASASDFLAVPDSQSGWIPFALRTTRRVLRRHNLNIVLSSGPPQSAHLVSAFVRKTRRNARWIADMRDPWGDNPHLQPLVPSAQRWNLKLENWCLKKADRIIANTNAANEKLSQRLSVAGSKTLTITNGFDSDDFHQVIPHALWPRSWGRVLLHSGTMYGVRDPIPFLAEARGLLRSLEPNSVTIVFLGGWEAALRIKVDQFARQAELQESVKFLDPVPRPQALGALKAADGLLLIGADATQIPAKVFEYLAARRPIVSTYPVPSAVDSLLRDYCHDYYRDSKGFGEVTEALLHGRQQTRRSGVRDIRELDRKNQVSQLNEILMECL